MFNYALVNAITKQDHDNLEVLLRIIQPALIVGGAVRNALLGIEIGDIDIATGLSPEEVKNQAKGIGLHIVDTGIQHGTVTVLMQGRAYEVTTLRKDVKTYGRKADVEFILSKQSYESILDLFKIDASRRDLTMNAVYADLNGNIFDFFNGINDLKEGIVKFIGDPEQRIKEDFLRILRFFRFGCYYGREYDLSSLAACLKLVNGLQKIAPERWTMELRKIFKHNSPWSTIQRMIPVFEAIGMNYDVESINSLVSEENKFGIKCGYVSKMSLLNDISHLKLSTREQKRIVMIKKLKFFNSAQDIADWAVTAEDDIHFWDGIITKGSCIHQDRINSILSRAKSYDIKGTDLIKLGYSPGPLLGKVMRRLHIQYCLEEYSREKLLSIAKLSMECDHR